MYRVALEDTQEDFGNDVICEDDESYDPEDYGECADGTEDAVEEE